MAAPSRTEQRIQILIIHSSEKNRRLYKAMFHDIDDCNIIFSNNPHEALQVFTGFIKQGFPFDIVFLDYQFPTTNGITLARKLKAAHSKTKLWFFESSHLKEEKIKKAYSELFGFFREPISTYDQIAEIVDHTRKKKQQQFEVKGKNQ